MLTKLEPQGSAVSLTSRGGLGDNDPTTSTLQDAMQRLHGQHLSGSGEGADVGLFLTPGGVRCPRGKSPPHEVSLTFGHHVRVEDIITLQECLHLEMLIFLEILAVWILLHPFSCSVPEMPAWDSCPLVVLNLPAFLEVPALQRRMHPCNAHALKMFTTDVGLWRCSLLLNSIMGLLHAMLLHPCFTHVQKHALLQAAIKFCCLLSTALLTAYKFNMQKSSCRSGLP